MDLSSFEFDDNCQSSIERYIQSVTLCNSLAILLSQSTVAEYVRRAAVLTKLQQCWAEGHSQVELICPDLSHESEVTCTNDSPTSTLAISYVVPAGIAHRSHSDSIAFIQSLYRLFDADECKDIVRRLDADMLKCSHEQHALLEESSNSHSAKVTAADCTLRSNWVPLTTRDRWQILSESSYRLQKEAVTTHRGSSVICSKSAAGQSLSRRKTAAVSHKLRLQKQNKSSGGVLDKSPADFRSDCNCKQPPGGESRRPRLHQRGCKQVPICSICGRRFAQRWGLRVHFMTHTGELPYVCRQAGCDRRFRQSGLRLLHERTHIPTPGFICVLCGRTYRSSLSLKVHTRDVHSETASLPPQHCCTQCGRLFKTAKLLKSHSRRTHSEERPNICDACPKRFKTLAQLKRHQMALHSDVRPWHCSVCDKTFVQAVNMRTHMRVHTGDKPYTCTVCGSSFSHSSTLKGHMATHGTNGARS